MFPTPAKVPEVSTLLDWLMVCALSGSNIDEWDNKSVAYFKQTLEFIEKKFSGLETFEVETVDPVTGATKKLQLHYFKSIASCDKVYHKVQVPNRLLINTDLSRAHD